MMDCCINPDWVDITGVPSDIADGDIDTTIDTGIDCGNACSNLWKEMGIHYNGNPYYAHEIDMIGDLGCALSYYDGSDLPKWHFGMVMMGHQICVMIMTQLYLVLSDRRLL